MIFTRTKERPHDGTGVFRHNRLWCLVMATVLLNLGATAGADTIERRGMDGPLHGRIMNIDDAGIGLAPDAGGATVTISWDRIRAVDMAFRDPKLDRYLPLAVDLWRARSRVERGDFALAEPVFARYFEQYVGKTNETALVVSEGLLRCRLARQANDLALIPALETARLLRAKQTTLSYSHLPRLFDDRTSLCTSIPPAFVVNANLANLQRELSQYRAKDDPVIGAISGLYLNAMQQLTRSAATSPPVESVTEQPGVALLRLLVSANSTDEHQRTTAREKLNSSLANLPPWSAAWARFAIGQALLRDSGKGQQQAGLVSMIHIPAQYASVQPYLAGLAMATIADWLQSNGQSESATALRLEMQKTYPVHPALAIDAGRPQSESRHPPS